MSLTILYEANVDRKILHDRTIAILGYGNQGSAHALNLRDSGCRVVVAQRPNSARHAAAMEDGFEPIPIAKAVQSADMLIFALPDEAMSAVFNAQIAPNLRPGQALGFIHGFAIRFGLVIPPSDVDVILIAPKGPGTLVRDAFARGGGVASLFAVHQNATGFARELALAWGAGIGGGRGGMMETTFPAECETDLFGEQTVLCGGVIELMKAAYDILVDAGYPEELAYFECIHEVKQIVDLQYAEGIAGMRKRISGTAAYGGLCTGPRLIGETVKREMQAVLKEIQSGEFAGQWMQECEAGKPTFNRLLAAESAHPSEAAGRRVREITHRADPHDA